MRSMTWSHHRLMCQLLSTLILFSLDYKLYKNNPHFDLFTVCTCNVQHKCPQRILSLENELSCALYGSTADTKQSDTIRQKAT